MADFNPGPDSSLATSNQGAFITCWDRDANFIWARNLDATSYNYATSLAVTTGEAVYFTGFYDGTIDLDPGYGVIQATAITNNFFYLEKLIPCPENFVQINASGPYTFCAGDSVQLFSSSGAYTYNWNNGSTDSSITVKQTGVFWVTVEDFERCATQAISVEVTVIEIPDSAGIITGSALVSACTNQLGIAYSVNWINGASTYNWTLPPLANIVSGAGTNAIIVDYSPYSDSGYVRVSGSNFCGVGPEAALFIEVLPIPEVELCKVTVDSATQFSYLEWQKPIETYVSGYVIYREIPPLSGNYAVIATIPDSVYSAYLDTNSTPAINSESYKIAVLDSCGNIGDISAAFKHETSRLYGSILAGGIAKIYWTDYIGIQDSSRYFNLLRDTTGSGPFNDTLFQNITPAAVMAATDLSSAAFPFCRYVAEMVYEGNCAPSMRMMAIKSTSRSNIKNKNALYDSSFVSVFPIKEPKSDISIYPNPAKDRITITGLNPHEKYSLKMNDAQGRLLFEERFIEISKKEISLENLPKGFFLLTIIGQQKTFHQKIQHY